MCGNSWENPENLTLKLLIFKKNNDRVLLYRSGFHWNPTVFTANFRKSKVLWKNRGKLQFFPFDNCFLEIKVVSIFTPNTVQSCHVFTHFFFTNKDNFLRIQSCQKVKNTTCFNDFSVEINFVKLSLTFKFYLRCVQKVS